MLLKYTALVHVMDGYKTPVITIAITIFVQTWYLWAPSVRICIQGLGVLLPCVDLECTCAGTLIMCVKLVEQLASQYRHGVTSITTMQVSAKADVEKLLSDAQQQESRSQRLQQDAQRLQNELQKLQVSAAFLCGSEVALTCIDQTVQACLLGSQQAANELVRALHKL